MYTQDELIADRDLSPFQGPDKLPRTIKVWDTSHTMTTTPKPWEPDKKATASQRAHVEMSQRIFRKDGLEFKFWAYAPVKAGYRRQGEGKSRDFVWLILGLGNGFGVHHALVSKETDEVYWWDPTCGVHWQKEEAS